MSTSRKLFTKCENEKDRFLIKDIREIDQITKKMLRIIIYGSDTLLKVLCESELITSDGTFDYFRLSIFLILGFQMESMGLLRIFPGHRGITLKIMDLVRLIMVKLIMVNWAYY